MSQTAPAVPAAPAASAPWPYPLRPWQRPLHYNDRAPAQALVQENTFIGRMPDRAFPPTLAEARPRLPEPHWAGHDVEIAAYWKAWDLCLRNTRRAPLETGFITPFTDAALNDCFFMWDSVFILMFARYGERAHGFTRMLDNFYAKQHANGFISREIREWSGEDQFHYADPNSTGPNTLHWAEWEAFQTSGDRTRLAAVFPCLLAYHRWLRNNRTWQDGTYWSTGWASGMDNQPRLSPGANPKWEHDHLSWLDATAQAVFSARSLLRMAQVLGRTSDIADIQAEADALSRLINATMWDESAGFYVDRRRDGSLGTCKSIGAFWLLLADIAPPERRARLIAHLSDPRTFGRPHAVPSLSADDPGYVGQRGGDYWCGAVWPSTNYMVLRGLTQAGEHALAHQLARNHHRHVSEVFRTTGTLWENYHPEATAPGNHAKADFVGWGGLGPIAVLLEYVFGLRPEVAGNTLHWDLRLTEAFGVQRYPFGRDTEVDLTVAARTSTSEAPVVTLSANRPLRVHLHWDGGERVVEVLETP